MYYSNFIFYKDSCNVSYLCYILCNSGIVTPVLGRFSEMNEILPKIGIQKNSLDGILIDAGCSSMQMDSASRGFSISKDGPLDMRMDGNR